MAIEWIDIFLLHLSEPTVAILVAVGYVSVAKV